MGRGAKKRKASAMENTPKEAYDDIIKENAMFEKYYREQNMISDDDFLLMMDYFRKPLPITFRIVTPRRYIKKIEDRVKTIVATLKNASSDNDQVELKCLDWYPYEPVWQLNLSRTEVRKCSAYSDLKTFLVQMNELGNICRQEAVSMIPPLLLDVKPDHKVLDMCAAPGSKTSQILQRLHVNDEVDGSIPSGLLIANDLNNKRTYTLAHQLKQFGSPNVVIINRDATTFPHIRLKLDASENADNNGVPYTNLLYDRILCDVPCTGDGTLRKASDIWKRWSPTMAYNLHGIQFRIVQRGFTLLRPGGLMVYSTCSLNPVENEAVVSRLLDENKEEGNIELVKPSLEGLKFIPGLQSWKLISKDGSKMYSCAEEVDENLKHVIRHYMFPSGNSDLSNCCRILPHLQDTGGFFLALIRKTKGADNDGGDEKEEPVKKQKCLPGYRRVQIYKESPFLFLAKETVSDELKELIESFGIGESFPVDQLMVRQTGPDSCNNVYFVSKAVRHLVSFNTDRVNFINTGVKLLSKTTFGAKSTQSTNDASMLRLCEIGLKSVLKHCTKRVISFHSECDLLVITKNAFPRLDSLSDALRTSIKEYGTRGCVVLQYDFGQNSKRSADLAIVAMLGIDSLRPFMTLRTRRLILTDLIDSQEEILQILEQIKKEEAISSRARD